MKTTDAVNLMRNVVRRKHLAYSTEDTYLYWLVQFCRYVATVPKELTSEQKVERWLTSLALKDVSASTQNQAFNAVLFFYKECLGKPLDKVNALRAKRGERLRRAPSVSEVREILKAVVDSDGYPTRLVVQLLYGCGLRVTEPLNLRVRDVDLDNSQLIIRGAKGNKDRVVALPCSLAASMRSQMDFAAHVAAIDSANGLPIKLPNRVAQKYPAAQFSKRWAFVFPLRNPCHNPRSGVMVRYRMLESTVQRAVKRACRKTGIEIVPHELRHAYATHCLNTGQNARAIQQAMGHKSLETTMGYLHAEALSVRSPLEAVET